MKTLGLEGPVFILASRTAKRLLAETWHQTFESVGFRYEIFEFGGECTQAEIRRGVEYARSMNARAVVGAGGGKALDAARGIACGCSVPIVNCPSLASSDAPCSALSVIYNAEGAFESYAVYGKNPDLVLVDTELIANAPARLLSAGMGDALATMFEAEAAISSGARTMRGGKSTLTARIIARTCYETLIKHGVDALDAVASQKTNEHLERVAEANTLLSGLGFESSGLAAAHAIHDGLTALEETHDFYHGEKVAFGTIVQLVLEKQPESVFTEVLNFATSVKLPVTLGEIGLADVSDDKLLKVAKAATAPHKTIHNEPFPVDANMVLNAMREADSIGQSWQKR